MRKGFTLIELIVVIAIIAVLAAIVAPNAFKAIEKGKISATIGDYKSIKTSAMAFYADTGQWPANDTDETDDPNPFTADDGTNGWDGPYLEKWPARAAWGGNYTFYDNVLIDWDDDGTNDDARYVEVTNIPDTAAARMDIQLDGAVDEDLGSIQYTDPNAATGDTIDVDFLVSMD